MRAKYPGGSLLQWFLEQLDLIAACYDSRMATGIIQALTDCNKHTLTQPSNVKLQILSVVFLCKDTIYSEQTLLQRFIH